MQDHLRASCDVEADVAADIEADVEADVEDDANWGQQFRGVALYPICSIYIRKKRALLK